MEEEDEDDIYQAAHFDHATDLEQSYSSYDDGSYYSTGSYASYDDSLDFGSGLGSGDLGSESASDEAQGFHMYVGAAYDLEFGNAYMQYCEGAYTGSGNVWT